LEADTQAAGAAARREAEGEQIEGREEAGAEEEGPNPVEGEEGETMTSRVDDSVSQKRRRPPRTPSCAFARSRDQR